MYPIDWSARMSLREAMESKFIDSVDDFPADYQFA
jgi:hypothetical protein